MSDIHNSANDNKPGESQNSAAPVDPTPANPAAGEHIVADVDDADEAVDRKPAVTRSKRKIGTSLIAVLVVVVIVAAALIVVGRHNAAANAQNAGARVVKVAYAQENDRVIWDKVNEVLKERNTGIQVELVAFQGGSDVAVQAANNGEVDILSNGHRAFYKNLVETKGYKLDTLGSTVINAFNIYSTQYKSVDEIPDGAKIAIPNNTTNAGRAYQVLQLAGLITIDPDKIDMPTKQDITSNPKNLDIEEVDPNEIPNLLDDYAAGITNVYAIVNHGLSPTDDAIFAPTLDLSDASNQQWINELEVRADRVNEADLKTVAAAYHSKEVADAINENFSGIYQVAFDY
ncbi:MAG: MetQ/NlpA family ABC transporter substrate-binding protein [Bifidobacteriaceae bacterium]|nr:MetQ/NlpA family ABC transporter substrate-binding protein [Bifidobacteriaceae bacterium]